MALTPELGTHMRGLANALLVHDYPGATIGRPSGRCWRPPCLAGNDCFFCMDSHAAFATVLLEGQGRDAEVGALDTHQGR